MSAKIKKVKLPAGLTDEFMGEIDASDRDMIKTKVVTLQKQLEDAQKFLKENEEIQNLKEQLKLLTGPSKETSTVLRNRTKYCLERLEQMGAL